jgi:glycosyltransferase involved in cell wall biosynthesis
MRVATRRRNVVVISTLHGSSWGGSEELWAATARKLVGNGLAVTASVGATYPLHPRLAELRESGIGLHLRRASLWLPAMAWRRLTSSFKRHRSWSRDVERMLASAKPDLVIVSDGGNFPPIELVEHLASHYPFVTISHNNYEEWWPVDEQAARYRLALAKARRCYFVSDGNRRLAERQLGCSLDNASIVRNPFNVDYDTVLPWPAPGNDGEIRFAAVGRLETRSKGQDLLIQALALPAWRDRNWRLTFYGEGPMRETLTRLSSALGLSDRITFAGHVEGVHTIWRRNHVLVQPSRHEGLPITIVEAMLCGRPVVATDVAGHAEVISPGVTGFLAQAPAVAPLAQALEQAWSRRADLADMGLAAARAIRQIAPRDPAAVFANELAQFLDVRNPAVLDRANRPGAMIRTP